MVPLSLAVFAVCLQSLLSISFYLHNCNIWTRSRQSASKGNYNYLEMIFGLINQNFIDQTSALEFLIETLVFRYFNHKHSIFILIVFPIFLRFPLSIKRACFPRFQSTWISCDINFRQKFGYSIASCSFSTTMKPQRPSRMLYLPIISTQTQQERERDIERTSISCDWRCFCQAISRNTNNFNPSRISSQVFRFFLS